MVSEARSRSILAGRTRRLVRCVRLRHGVIATSAGVIGGEAHDRFCEGGLARTVGTEDGEAPVGVEGEADAVRRL